MENSKIASQSDKDNNPWTEHDAAPELSRENESLRAELKSLQGMTQEQRQAHEESKAQMSAVRIGQLVQKKLSNPLFVNMDELVAHELLMLTGREEAKRQHKTQNIQADLSLFDGSLDLNDAFAANYAPPEWRIKGLLRVGHITTVAGAAKSGKTSLLVNRVKSYVDGNPLFGQFQMGQTLKENHNVGVWNFELTEGTMTDWFRNAGIVNRDRVKLINARGAGLMIQNELVLERAIAWCNANKIEILEIDPLQAAFTGSINSDEDAADFIHALERIQKQSCVTDIILTTHMGHGAKNSPDHERSIGSARWEGFADNMWLYKRPDDIGLLRIDKGRDVFMEEFGVLMDPDTKILAYQKAPKVLDENWNAMLRILKDGKPHEKSLVKEANGSASKSKSAIIKHLKWIEGYGLLQEFGMKLTEKGGSEYSIDGTHGQEKLFVQLNDTGTHLLHEETEDIPIPDKLWFEGHGMYQKVGKGG